MKRTDRDWERWGANSPYFGVLSAPQFRNSRLDGTAESEFFASGEAHVASLWAAIEKREGQAWRASSTVDVGCGVGRLALPMAGRCDSVLAVDVSESMLAEVQRNCVERGITNVRTARADDSLSAVPAGATLVHSYLVLQHVAPERGYKIIEAMAGRVAEDGYLAFQVYVACNTSPALRALVKLRYGFPPANWLRNLLKGRPLFEQAMQLHVYRLSKIFRSLREAGFCEAEVFLDTEDGGNFESTFILAKKAVRAAAITNRYA